MNGSPAEFEALGLGPAASQVLSSAVNAVLQLRELGDPTQQTKAWDDLRHLLVASPDWRWNFAAHHHVFRLVYERRQSGDGPPIAWTPSSADVRESNLASLMREEGLSTYADLHRWSVDRRERFWSTMLRRLGIVFHRPPDRILAPGSDLAAPEWLPGARMNIAESCFTADPAKVAILYASEEAPDLRRVTYGQLRRLANQVANGIRNFGVAPGERVALFLPMTPEAVAIYLGAILAGRPVVGIADASAPEELKKRIRIGGAKVVFTIESYRRDGKDLPVYEKVLRAEGPPAIVLPQESASRAEARRPGDRTFDEFLGPSAWDAVPGPPGDATNVLFSSGTTKDPKAIVWTHTTPIKSAADAYLHHDVRPSDVLAWPTSFGWMMGPWLTYASLVNRATMALHVGSPQRRAFGEFVEGAGVSMLGVVPKLVRSWKEERTMEGLDWSHVRRFSSTAEPSTPEEMLYLMFLSGYTPVIEYCGGTEVGGGYLTGTLLQPSAPATFTTPALGLDVVILDDGRTATKGEVFLVPPSIGFSNELLNYDHRQEYFAGLPAGPNGELLRRHGDQIERLPGGFYRHLGRIDDVINLHGVKTSAEEIRSVIGHEAVHDAKPAAVDVDGSGQYVLIVYAVPKDPRLLGSADFCETLRTDFQRAIRDRLNPLLAQIHEVVLVPELPQAGPGKTRTIRELERDYRRRTGVHPPHA